MDSDTENRDGSSNHSSDLDDWALLSPPHSSSSSSSSPEQEDLSPEHSSSNSSLEIVGADGLSEIDLTTSNAGPGRKHRKDQALKQMQNAIVVEAREVKENDDSCLLGAGEPVFPGFQAIDSTTDEDDGSERQSHDGDNNDANGASRRSSLTQSELNEYVDFGRTRLDDSEITLSGQQQATAITSNDDEDGSINTIEKNEPHGFEQEHSNNGEAEKENVTCLHSIRAKLDELSDHAATSGGILHHRARGGNRGMALRFSQLYQAGPTVWPEMISALPPAFRRHFYVLLTMVYASLLCFLLNFVNQSYQNMKRDSLSSDNNWPKFLSDSTLDSNFNLGTSIPFSHQYVELQQLHNELKQCIKRQSPTSFKYYLSEDRIKDSSVGASTRSQKPYRGLVCYGQETQWRKRFEQLKSEHDLDLRRLMQEAKKQLTNEMLEFYHPSLKFKLILNQIEYLDFLENKRAKRQYEETINNLRAENMQLLRRLSQPNETGYQKLVVGLELENSKLQRENEVLKANLLEKAGPIYIKQSLELEQYERENVILKQFHYQVAQDVSKNLKQFNLHTIDASTILDDHESLNTQLMLTRGYLRRLSEKVSAILIENEALKEELKEIYITTSQSVNKANLPATHTGGGPRDHRRQHANDINESKALVSDCMRSLKRMTERSSQLEIEVNLLKRKCPGAAELERSSGRHLNRTTTREEDYQHSTSHQSHSISWNQLDSTAAGTAMGKRADDSVSSLRDDDIFDELMAFLTKFNSRVESNGLSLIEHESTKQQQPHEAEFMNAVADKQKGEAKIIPNYIREVYLQQKTRNGGLNKYQEGRQIGGTDAHIKLPPTPPVMYSAASTNSSPGGSPKQVPKRSNDSRAQQPNGHHHSTPIKSLKSHLPAQQQASRQEADVGYGHVDSMSMDISATTQDQMVEYPATVAARDTWFFKRAKQRRQLRLKEGGLAISHADWMMKRAKLREKLRKATSYIDHNYRDSKASYGQQADNNRGARQGYNHNDDCRSRRSHHHKENKKQTHHRRSYTKYVNDEL